MDYSLIRCLGCRREFQTPSRVLRMAERYEGQPVAFCSKRCNLRWVDDQGRRSQEAEMVALIERLKRGNTRAD